MLFKLSLFVVALLANGMRTYYRIQLFAVLNDQSLRDLDNQGLAIVMRFLKQVDLSTRNAALKVI